MKRPKPIKGIRQFVHKHRPAINEVVREPTAGGVVFRRSKPGADVEILLIQDAKNRWTIPKGHIESGETSRETAEREVREETGLKNIKVRDFLGKINFRYRRVQSLVLMTTEIFLIEAHAEKNKLKAEEWMNDIRWFKAMDALDKIEYEDIGKIILIALKKIRTKH